MYYQAYNCEHVGHRSLANLVHVTGQLAGGGGMLVSNIQNNTLLALDPLHFFTYSVCPNQ